MNKNRFVKLTKFTIPYVLVLLVAILPIYGFAYARANPQAANTEATNAESEPLTETERWAILNGAFQAGIASGATSLEEATAMRQEVLLIESNTASDSQDSDAGGAAITRAGNAYVYDYTTDTLNVVTIDLATGQASNLRSSKGVQIQLTQNEIERALFIAIGNTEILEQTKTAYLEQTGEPFTQLNQITTDAAIFNAVDAPNVVNMQSAECGIHRCAVLTLKTASGSAIGIQPIVDLSIQSVVQNNMDPDAMVSAPGDLGFVDTGNIVDENSVPELPGATDIPLAAAESGNLGITTPGTIIDESAVAEPAATTPLATTPSATQDSLAPSKQTDLGFVDTGMILSESEVSNNGMETQASTSPSHQNDLGTVNTGLILDEASAGPAGPTGQDDDDLLESGPTDLGFVDTGMIVAESTDSGTAGTEAASEHQTTLGAAKANIFIPFMARRLFKDKGITTFEFQEELFLTWWCGIVDDSPLAAEVSGVCNR